MGNLNCIRLTKQILIGHLAIFRDMPLPSCIPTPKPTFLVFLFTLWFYLWDQLHQKQLLFIFSFSHQCVHKRVLWTECRSYEKSLILKSNYKNFSYRKSNFHFWKKKKKKRKLKQSSIPGISSLIPLSSSVGHLQCIRIARVL